MSIKTENYKALSPDRQQDFRNWLENTEWSSRHSLKRKLENGYFDDWQDLLIAFDEDVPAGYLAMVKEDEGVTEYTPYIAYVYISPDFRGRNIPAILISQAEQYLKEQGFHCAYILTGHENYYQRHGYEPQGRAGEKQEILFAKEF